MKLKKITKRMKALGAFTALVLVFEHRQATMMFWSICNCPRSEIISMKTNATFPVFTQCPSEGLDALLKWWFRAECLSRPSLKQFMLIAVLFQQRVFELYAQTDLRGNQHGPWAERNRDEGKRREGSYPIGYNPTAQMNRWTNVQTFIRGSIGAPWKRMNRFV